MKEKDFHRKIEAAWSQFVKLDSVKRKQLSARMNEQQPVVSNYINSKLTRLRRTAPISDDGYAAAYMIIEGRTNVMKYPPVYIKTEDIRNYEEYLNKDSGIFKKPVQNLDTEELIDEIHQKDPVLAGIARKYLNGTTTDSREKYNFVLSAFEIVHIFDANQDYRSQLPYILNS